MTTTQFTNVTSLPLSNTSGDLSDLYDASPLADRTSGINHLLQQIAQQLQTSLDIDEVLLQFSHEINPFVPHDYLGYTNDRKSCTFSMGKNARHRQNYQLAIRNEQLGQLVLSRKRKFSKKEIEMLENLTSALLYPLRNALMYRDAIRAAQKDTLTGTGNRAAFNEAISREMEVAQRHERTLSMIIFDIDHFKNINDSYGHNTGDCLLKALTKTAEDTIRISDQLFRYGGEEFIVLLPETGLSGVKRLAERIRRNVETLTCVCEGHHIKMTASFGIAILNADETEESFFIRADKAMYKAKHEGRNCTRIAE
ncbi:GGDEF domain-containing protein [Beggiatoa alba]|nr:GGDEF domain-containing protein [Beggiatoa alba]